VHEGLNQRARGDATEAGTRHAGDGARNEQNQPELDVPPPAGRTYTAEEVRRIFEGDYITIPSGGEEAGDVGPERPSSLPAAARRAFEVHKRRRPYDPHNPENRGRHSPIN
jgi:hypothetical protein